MSKEDAQTVMRICSKYEPLFVDMMLVDELGLEPPDESSEANALVHANSDII